MPDKSQMHLRMTYIPAAGVPDSAVGARAAPPSHQAVRGVSPDRSVDTSRVLNTSTVAPRVLQHQLSSLPVRTGPADIGITLSPTAAPGGVKVESMVSSGPAATSRQILVGDIIIDVDGTGAIVHPTPLTSRSP